MAINTHFPSFSESRDPEAHGFVARCSNRKVVETWGDKEPKFSETHYVLTIDGEDTAYSFRKAGLYRNWILHVRREDGRRVSTRKFSALGDRTIKDAIQAMCFNGSIREILAHREAVKSAA